MTETPNYGLNQWALTDPVRMSDFNQDNVKIDAALKSVLDTALRRAQIETGSYDGDGSSEKTLQFSFAPELVVIYATNGGSSVRFGIMMRSSPYGYVWSKNNNENYGSDYWLIYPSFSGNQVRMSGISQYLNLESRSYRYIAIG